MSVSNDLGILYVVAMPIGNLEDITLRALRILKEVDYILCEDKRVTIKLLNKYDIKTNLIAFHKFNETKQVEYILSLLEKNKKIAIVSDAGTPLISDPGLKLVSQLLKNNYKIYPIPGPSALTCALSICPLFENEFLFVGFLPNNKTKRENLIKNIADRANLAVIFVAPHDLLNYLEEICKIYPNAEVFLTREMTKIYEEYQYCLIKDLIEKVKNKKVKGEIVLFIRPNRYKEYKSKSKEELLNELNKKIKSGFSLKEASGLIALENNLSKKEIYNLFIKDKRLQRSF